MTTMAEPSSPIQLTTSLDTMLKNLLVNASTWIVGLKSIQEWLDTIISFLPPLQSVLQYRDNPDKLRKAIALSIEADWPIILLKMTEYLMPYHDFWESLVIRMGSVRKARQNAYTMENMFYEVDCMQDYERMFPLTIRIALDPLMTSTLDYTEWMKLFRYVRLFSLAAKDISSTVTTKKQ